MNGLVVAQQVKEWKKRTELGWNGRRDRRSGKEREYGSCGTSEGE